ncbi:hypothetical protein BN14_10903 [Rhizoctonia solani AG-1 IB]|uniref:Uncharacterized protein n=2 Tax=Rhizoctonia solani TaxID=456999 RepID=A0A8H3A003_9AGAM|nr:unnamed protein product [Rhizoctonia solani]CCO36759.1 hypothetical protein BN14_10903 [Rhizoctonia solani AG-1 IB]
MQKPVGQLGWPLGPTIVHHLRKMAIGSATIPPSEQFIAIATLDNSLVTYSLREGGPDVETHFEVNSREVINYRPVLPIVSTSSELILKGTAVGDIDVLDPRTNSTASLHHGTFTFIKL